MNFLRQSTAATIQIGPFVDSTDGVTPEAALGLVAADVRSSKNGAAFGAAGLSTDPTHTEDGYYSAALDTTAASAVGRLRIKVNKTGAMPVWEDYVVLSANVYDWLFGTTAPNTVAPLDATGVRAAFGLAAANLDTQLADLPTNSEFAARTLPAANYFDPASDSVTLAASQPNYAPAKAGDAMALTSGERTATAVEVESHLLDEGDSQMLINAIVGAIGNTNVDQVSLIAAIRADLERTGGNLATLLDRITAARLAKLDVSGTLAHSDAAATYKADVTGLSTFDPTTDEVDVGFWRGTKVTSLVSGSIGNFTAHPSVYVANIMDGAVRGDVGLSAADLGTRLDAIPTVAEFAARTKPTGDYFDPATDTVTVGTNNDKTGYSLANAPPTASTIAFAVWGFSNAVVSPSTFGATVAGLTGLINAVPTVEEIVSSIPTPPSAATVAAEILATPANKLATNADGSVDATVSGVTVDEQAIADAVTSAIVSQLGSGDGSVAVDHDYGGTDTLRITTAAGAGIDNVMIRAYLAADWAAGNRSDAFVVGRTTTTADGRWESPLGLDPATYTLLFTRQADFRAKTTSLIVT